MTSDARVTISHLGRDGDGATELAGHALYLPDALPGETFAVSPDGTAARVGEPSSRRIAPVCRHFGRCGGCVAQHMAPALYREWKEGLIRSAFRSHGLDIDLAPLRGVLPGARRRVALTARVRSDIATLGFHARGTHDLIDLAECPVSAPAIVAALPALRALAAEIGAQELRLTIAATAGGLDVDVAGNDRPIHARSIARLAEIAQTAGLARLTADGETIAQTATPTLAALTGAIPLPPGAFFQAAAESERLMVDLVVAGVGKAKRVADLFAGLGTFSLPIARRARVFAVDSDKRAIAALIAAARTATGIKPIATRVRDLIDEPLSPLELADVDAVVFDPPRAGAKAQCEQLAKSKIRTVVAVSCNPATLARDCRILVDAGFEMGRVHGIDQFLWSSHVEAVVTLTR